MPRFCVAGAGIAGLLAAVALGREGHGIQIFERRAVLDEFGAGLQLSPNATRVARHLGILDRLTAISIESQAVRIRRGDSGAELTALPLGAAARARYGAPFLLVHRADLQSVLAEAARELPHVGLELGTPVIETDPGAGTAVVRRPAGAAIVQADGVVRADGLHAGAVRTPAGTRPRFSGKTAWRAVVPAEALPPHFARPESNIWLGRRAHVVHYPLRNAALVNVVIVIDESPTPWRDADVWAEPGDPVRLGTHFVGWHSQVRQLIAAAPSWRTWPLFDRVGGRWSQARQTVVGDAAHPMLPFLAQGASQAFEDAAALAQAVAAHREDMPAAFRLYETARLPEARRVQEASRRQGRIYHLSGLAALGRDLTLRMHRPERLLARMDWLYGARPPAPA